MALLSRTDQQFLTLLKAGLWQEAPATTLFEPPTDWEAIILQARRQSVSPTIFDGMSLLPKSLQPPQQVLFSWYADTMRTEKYNELLNRTLGELVTRFRAAGLDPIVLKGQSMAQYYRNPAHRQPGDIDLYFPYGYDQANLLAEQWAKEVSEKDKAEQDYVVQLSYLLPNGVLVENHREYAFFFSRLHEREWKALEQTLRVNQGESFRCGEADIKVLSPTLNALYVFQHLLRHLLSFGVGFRQVSDWIYFLKAEQENIDTQQLVAAAEKMHFTRPMAALSYIAIHHLGAPPIFPFDLSSKQVRDDAALLLTDILRMGNFGHDTLAMHDKDSRHLFKKIRAYAEVVARFVRISRFGTREMLGACRFFVMKNWKNTWRYFLPQK